MLRPFQIIRARLTGSSVVKVVLVGSASPTTVTSKRSVHSSHRCLVPSLHRIPFRWMPSVALQATKDICIFKRRSYHRNLPTSGGSSDRPPKRHEWTPKFDDVPGLHPLSKLAIRQAGLKRMTEIQSKVWPHALAGRDIIGRVSIYFFFEF